MAVKGFNKVIVKAIDFADIKIFYAGLKYSMKLGRVFMFHTGSTIPLVLDGVTDKPLLTREKMLKPDNDKRGIIVGIWDWAKSPIPN